MEIKLTEKQTQILNNINTKLTYINHEREIYEEMFRNVLNSIISPYGMDESNRSFILNENKLIVQESEVK